MIVRDHQRVLILSLIGGHSAPWKIRDCWALNVDLHHGQMEGSGNQVSGIRSNHASYNIVPPEKRRRRRNFAPLQLNTRKGGNGVTPPRKYGPTTKQYFGIDKFGLRSHKNTVPWRNYFGALTNWSFSRKTRQSAWATLCCDPTVRWVGLYDFRKSSYSPGNSYSPSVHRQTIKLRGGRVIRSI